MDLYQNFLSHPEIIFGLLPFLYNNSPEPLMDNNDKTDKKQFLGDLFQPINKLLPSNLQRRQQYRSKKKNNQYELFNNDILLRNVFSNDYNFENNNQLQEMLINSFKQNFLENDNNFIKLLYLLQFQVNPSIIVSAKSIKYDINIYIYIYILLYEYYKYNNIKPSKLL